MRYVFLIVVVSLSILLGAGVFLADSKNRTNRFYFLTSLSITFWVLFGYLVYYEPLSNFSSLMGRANFAAVAFFFIAMYGFARNFPAPERMSLFDKSFIISGSLLSVLSLTTPFVVKSVIVNHQIRTWNFGALEYVYYLYGLIAAFFVIYTIFRHFHSRKQKSLIQIKLLGAGITLAALFNIIFNILIPLVYPMLNIYWIGDYSLIFILGFTAFAIAKFQLFDIKLIATEIIVFLLSIGLLIDTFISNDLNEGILKAVIWALATYGGWQLIKSVKHEIEQKEKIEKLAKDLEKANEHLKEVDKLKDDFLSMASHELNTPIAAIKGYLSMILVEGMGGKIPSKARTYLSTVYTSAERLANMVKDLLNVSRIESNRIHIIWEQKPIEDIINQAITEVMSKSREAGHTLTFEAPKHKMPATWFDSTRITEIMINMLGNSIKYTPNGGKITVRAVHDDDKIVVSVEDNGKGIPKDKQNAVFEKFSQVDVLKDEVKGTGLGMYIAKKFIALHKGKIWFHSDGEGKGTTFFFSLPIIKEKPFDVHEGEDAVLH